MGKKRILYLRVCHNKALCMVKILQTYVGVVFYHRHTIAMNEIWSLRQELALTVILVV